jgi:hypothetical protein
MTSGSMEAVSAKIDLFSVCVTRFPTVHKRVGYFTYNSHHSQNADDAVSKLPLKYDL